MQNHQKFSELAILDTKTGKVQFYSKMDNSEVASLPTSGFYCLIAGQMLCFFKYKKKLFFRIDNTIIELDNDTRVDLSKKGKYRFFQISKNNEMILSFKYLPKKIEPPLKVDFISSFVEEEDFDFCLFVYNVINNPDRKALM